VTSVRELTTLQQTQHPNIVSLLKVVTGTRPDRYLPSSPWMASKPCYHSGAVCFGHHHYMAKQWLSKHAANGPM